MNKNIEMLPSENQSENVIYGKNPVLELLKSGTSIDVVYISGDNHGFNNKIKHTCRELGIVVKETKHEKIRALTNIQNHQGVCAMLACAEYSSVEDILEISRERGTAPFIVVCDGIEDPHNLGAIIRTAEAVGADGIIIPKRRSASLNQTVFKTSAGAAAHIKVARVANLAESLETLKKANVWLYGAASSDENKESQPYDKVDFSGAAALVIGSEGDGLSELVMKKCDFLIEIPMRGKINSLNASVAAGILMFAMFSKR